jgi:hypothetical protein
MQRALENVVERLTGVQLASPAFAVALFSGDPEDLYAVSITVGLQSDRAKVLQWLDGPVGSRSGTPMSSGRPREGGRCDYALRRMAEVVVFHHALGLTHSLLRFAEELRAAGHVVHTPDLLDGRTFSELSEGVAYSEQLGGPMAVVERARTGRRPGRTASTYNCISSRATRTSRSRNRSPRPCPAPSSSSTPGPSTTSPSTTTKRQACSRTGYSTSSGRIGSRDLVLPGWSARCLLRERQ